MRACLLCGAKSWGKIGSDEDSVSEARMQLILTVRNSNPSLDHFLKCDGCGILAQKVLVEVPEHEPDAEFHSPFEAIGDALRALPDLSPTPTDTLMERLGKLMEDRMPVPQTRLERLVCAVLKAKPAGIVGLSKEAVAIEIVRFARLIEEQMGKQS